MSRSFTGTRSASNPFTVFYAWQSDLPNSTNRGFIKDALAKAIRKANREISIDQPDRDDSAQLPPSIQLDHDTQGVPGSPDLASTILQKIENADLFVADISFIGANANGEKKLPNPNVLIELGYALAVLGPERVIMLLNTATGTSEELPFDIRHKRHISYHAAEGGTSNSAEKQKLANILLSVIQTHFQITSDVAREVEMDVELFCEKQNIVPANNQWGFSFHISATNRTKATIVNYELVALIPKGLFSNGSRSFESPARNTDTHLAFVYPMANQKQATKRLMPGKPELLINASALLFLHNLGRIWETMDQAIELTFYADNIEPLRQVISVKELNPYRLLKVNPEKLQFHQKYRVLDFPDERITTVEKCSCH